MTLDEQRDVIERSLGERMLNHAFVILHQWLQEIGFQMYGNRLQSLERNYDALFQNYLSADDEQRDDMLNDMTAETYRLVDEVFVDMCLKHGRYPQMVGFNRDNIESVVRYFGSCPRLREEDYDYIREITLHNPQPSIALLLIAALLRISRECFSEATLLCLIDAIGSENRLIANQAMVVTILLLVHYDVRIDYFTRVQEAFMEAIGDGELAFRSVLAMVTASTGSVTQLSDSIDISKSDNVEQTIHDAIAEQLGEEMDDDMEHVVSWIPSDETDYYRGLVTILPNTWLIDALVGEDDERATMLSRAYLQIGNMDLWWDNIDDAEPLVLHLLRSNNPKPKDYINYGHICFLRGDKLMAYENYREARRLYGSSKAFLNAFRPDRRFLVDRGIHLEDVYLMEDQLVKAK